MRKRPSYLALPSWLSAVVRVPGVGETLRWLSTCGRPCPLQIEARTARLRRLVRDEEGRWKTDGPAFERALLRAIRRLPRAPDKLAALLCGFGEMAARCHYDPTSIVEAKLRQLRLSHRELIELIEAAVELAWTPKRPPTRREVSLAQTFAAPRLDWELLEIARSWVRHEPEMSLGGHYGLVFALRLVLRLQPRVLRQWHALNVGKPVTSLLMQMTGCELWHDRDALPDRLLSMRLPFATASAVAMFANRIDAGTENVSYSSVVLRLVDHGASPSEAIWMSAHILKDAIHRHHFLASQAKGLAFEVRLDQKQRKLNTGHIASNSIAARRADHVARKQAHERRLEALLEEVAAVWPAGGLCKEEMSHLDAAFVDTPEFRLRLSAKLSHVGNRRDLLMRNIERFKADVGISDDPYPVFDQYHAPEPEPFYEHASVSARSLIALHRTVPDEVGKKTAQLLAKTVEAGFELLGRPFMPARHSMRWQSALSRTACCLIFALSVVGAVDVTQQPAVAKLKQLALQHSANVLALSHYSIGKRSVLDTLGNLSVHCMTTGATGRAELIAWALREDLPPLVRAHAIWAADNWSSEEQELAPKLFRSSAEKPLSARAEPEHMNRIASLVDFAAARAVQVDDQSRLPLLDTLWAELTSEWAMHMAECRDFASVLARGMLAQGPDRQRILEDEIFAGTYSRAMVESPSSSAS